jgi:hypothetical protein
LEPGGPANQNSPHSAGDGQFNCNLIARHTVGTLSENAQPKNGVHAICMPLEHRLSHACANDSIRKYLFCVSADFPQLKLCFDEFAGYHSSQNAVIAEFDKINPFEKSCIAFVHSSILKLIVEGKYTRVYTDEKSQQGCGHPRTGMRKSPTATQHEASVELQTPMAKTRRPGVFREK